MSESKFEKKISKELTTKNMYEICVKEGLIKEGKKVSQF